MAGGFDAPCRTKNIAREIPPSPWYRSMTVHMAIGGFLPFRSVPPESGTALHLVFCTWPCLALTSPSLHAISSHVHPYCTLTHPVQWVAWYNITRFGSLFFPPSPSPSPSISAISVELYYIFATVWGREAYTLYGILLVVFLILISVTACISVALTYFQLSTEDYRWWWRSIFSSGWVEETDFSLSQYFLMVGLYSMLVSELKLWKKERKVWSTGYGRSVYC